MALYSLIPRLKDLPVVSLRLLIKFPLLWKQAAVLPTFKKGNNALVLNYRPILILSSFFKIFESIVHSHLSFIFKCKLHADQHDFIK